MIKTQKLSKLYHHHHLNELQRKFYVNNFMRKKINDQLIYDDEKGLLLASSFTILNEIYVITLVMIRKMTRCENVCMCFFFCLPFSSEDNNY